MNVLITGVFFQDQSALGLGYGDVDGIAGPRVIIQNFLLRAMFTGLISKDENGVLTGGLSDTFGNSTLSDIQISDTHLTFGKTYAGRRDEIRYTFEKSADGSWIGTYAGSDVGTGTTRAWTQEIPDDALLPGPIVEALGLARAFTPP